MSRYSCLVLYSHGTNSHKNKHEILKNHGPQLAQKFKILCASNLSCCPANGCDVESKYKHNIVTHLRMFVELKKKRTTVANNKVCPVCSKVFTRKSNRNRHVIKPHQDFKDDFIIKVNVMRISRTSPYIRWSLLLILYLLKSPQISLPKYLYPMIRIWKKMYYFQMCKCKICRVKIKRK